MEVEKILKLDLTEAEKIGMLLSNRIDLFYNGNAALTAQVWDDLVKDLIAWKNTEVDGAESNDSKGKLYQCPNEKSCDCKWK